MKQTIHFISGLPRSGSTLLSAILRQNPLIHAGMTSPVGPVFNAALTAMGAENEFSVFCPPGRAHRRRSRPGRGRGRA